LNECKGRKRFIDVTSCFDTIYECDTHTDKSDIVRPGYGRKSHYTQFQTRSLLFIQEKRRPTTDSIIISPPPFSISLPTLLPPKNAARTSNQQSAAECRPIAAVAVAAVAGSRPSASSVPFSPVTIAFMCSVSQKISPPKTFCNIFT